MHIHNSVSRVVIGAGCSGKLSQLLPEITSLNISKVLLVSDKQIQSLGLLDSASAD
ncbi:MAG: alcohol dehydrogenase class IV [Porticoccaceae bacterium]|jgi:alcohol dehydrogenase class IV